MKKMLLFISCLVLLSLACLSSVAAVPSTPAAVTETPAPDLVLAAELVQEQDEPTMVPTSAGKLPSCALITAIEALHLRSDADPRSQVLAFMKSGEEVRLISKAKGDWWLIERSGVVGFARSKYLQEELCQ
jgi:uncharacterized protein YgiM (DUF1202 family)